MPRLLLLNGPNLDRLGTREPHIYGPETLTRVVDRVRTRAAELGWEVEDFQSNSESELVDRVRGAAGVDAVIINAGALSHHSHLLADALRETGLPAVEVHISNIHRRETWRHRSVTAAACVGIIAGLGTDGYLVALEFLDRRRSR